MKNRHLFWYQLRLLLRYGWVCVQSGQVASLTVGRRLFIGTDERMLWQWAYYELVKGEHYAPKEISITAGPRVQGWTGRASIHSKEIRLQHYIGRSLLRPRA